MLRRHIVLLIAYCPSDGDVKPGGPIGAFRVEQAVRRHRVSPSPFLSSSSHTTQLHYTNSYTYSHPNLNFLQHYTDTLPTRNVVCPSSAWFENRPRVTPCAEPEANNSAVGWHWNRQTDFSSNRHIYLRCSEINSDAKLTYVIIIISVLPKGRSFAANSGTKAAFLPKGRSSIANSGT